LCVLEHFISRVLLTCAASSCPLLTIANSDIVDATGDTLDSANVSCSPGFNTSIGSSWTVTCLGVAAGQSAWSPQHECGMICCALTGRSCCIELMRAGSCSCVSVTVCEPLTVAHSDALEVLGIAGSGVLVTCGAGFASSSGSSFAANCTGPLWETFSCEAVACPVLDVAQSNVSSLRDQSLETTVWGMCNSGYNSSRGVSWATSCVGTAPGLSAWLPQPPDACSGLSAHVLCVFCAPVPVLCVLTHAFNHIL
jgi:hypothetical protein